METPNAGNGSLLDDETEDEKKDQKVVYQTDAQGNTVVPLGPDLVVGIRELNGHDSLKADSMLGSNVSPLVICKLYALFALQWVRRSGDLVQLPSKKNDLEIYARAKIFTARELTKLMGVYADEFMAPPDGEDLKNEPAPQQEQ